MLLQLFNDETGFIVTVELLLIVTIVVIGLIAGLAVLRDAVNAELNDVGAAIRSLSQTRNELSQQPQLLDSGFQDNGDSPVDEVRAADNCVQVFGFHQ